MALELERLISVFEIYKPRDLRQGLSRLFSVPQFTYLENKGNTALCDEKIVLPKLLNRVLHGNMEAQMECDP